MVYKINWSIAEGAFAVPDCVVDDYIKLASGKAVKVLLYILRNKIVNSDNAQEISESLDKRISCEDVEDAFSYWEQVGVICPTTAVATPLVATVPKVKAVETPTQATVAKNEVSAQREKERSTKMLAPKEIAERIGQSKELEFLFNSTEALLGKVLTNTEQRTLIWMHDYYAMGPDIILMVIDFCKSIDKANFGYIEKIVSSWNDKGISTHEQAEAEILQMQNYHSLAGRVVSKLGLNRSLTSKEREFVNNWAIMGIDISLVEYAYEKTISATGKVTFNYMNKILEGWHENNLHTVAEVDNFNELYAKSKAQKSGDTPTKTYIKTEEHSYDLNKLLEHAMNNTPKIKED